MSSAIHTTCDVAIARAAEWRSQPRYPTLVLPTTILASSLAFIDGSVVNVGLPAISGTFHAGAEDLQWVINAYLLPLSALLLLGGGLGDHFGQVRLQSSARCFLALRQSPALSLQACLGCSSPGASKGSEPHY